MKDQRVQDLINAAQQALSDLKWIDEINEQNGFKSSILALEVSLSAFQEDEIERKD